MGYDGFKRELFGYNKAQVSRAIEQIYHNNEKQIAGLNQTIGALEKENGEYQAKAAEVEAERQKVEKLAVSVGRLYVISRANAAAVVRAAEESAKASRKATEQSLETVAAAQGGIAEAEKEFNIIMNEFNEKIAQLSDSLNQAKLSVEASAGELNEASRKNAKTITEAEIVNA